jgi:sugar transferase (PEP-CTERM system associated)
MADSATEARKTQMRVRLRPGTATALLDIALVVVGWAPVALLTGQPIAATVYALAAPAAAYATGLYRRDAIQASAASLGRLPVAAGLGAMGALLLLAAVPPLAPLHAAAALFPLAFVGFMVAGAGSRVLLALLRRRGLFRWRVLVFGTGARAWELALLLRREGRHVGYDLVFTADRAAGPADPRLQGEAILPLGNRPLLALAREVAPDVIVVAPDERRGMRMEPFLECKIAGYPVQEYLAFMERELGRVDLKRLDLSWLVYGEGFRSGPLDRWVKRASDVVVSLLLLVLCAPLLLLGTLAVLVDDGRPVFYRQERVTRGGRSFSILKLRTMRRDAERAGAVWAAQRDPRITRVGAFLRRTRLDELPQFFNVLGGSMSLVGPRPERPEFVESLAAAIPLYRERHAVKAGLTGWAQINYPYGASIDDARSKLSYDLYYIKKFGLLLDMLIVVQTIRAVVWPKGAGAR